MEEEKKENTALTIEQYQELYLKMKEENEKLEGQVKDLTSRNDELFKAIVGVGATADKPQQKTAPVHNILRF